MRTKRSNVLIFIKTVHTAIWAFYVALIGYVVYAGIADQINRFLFIAIGLVLLEGIIFLY